MLRISKLTDYGTVVMAYLARQGAEAHTAKEIAQNTYISLPTVSKLLKLLTRQGLLNAQRGIKGGYCLSTSAEKISLVTIINAIEGNIALTECGHNSKRCAMEPSCAIRSNWQVISNSIRTTLSGITLAAMTKPLKPIQVQHHLETHGVKEKSL